MSKDIGLQRGTVQLVPHNPKWHDYFLEEKQLLLDTFGDRIKAIEHIGSTSIPDLYAKPIIDIIVAVDSLADVDDFVNTLPTLGYEYMPDRWFEDRIFFPKGPESNRTHHVHLTEIDSQTAWKNQIFFREYMKTRETARREYESLKLKLANKHSDNREVYTESKKDFIMKINALAAEG